MVVGNCCLLISAGSQSRSPKYERALVESWPDSLFLLLLLFIFSARPPPQPDIYYGASFCCSSSRPNSRVVCSAWSSACGPDHPVAQLSSQIAPENVATTVKPAAKWSVECSCSSGRLHGQVQGKRHQRSGRQSEAEGGRSRERERERGKIA